jgi:glyoxylate/hydroxypyruvate reductase A
MLPLTPETTNILNAELFTALPKGASIINTARGQHLNEEDLLDALGSGQISAATLDVFHVEPLPKDHPFWDHPNVLVTPHVASLLDPAAGGEAIAINILKFVAGEEVENLIPEGKGY